MSKITTTDAVLRDFLNSIAPVRSKILKLILFGSRARGDYSPDSDYDLLIVVKKKEPALIDALYESVMDVLLTHGRLVSLKIFKDSEFNRLQALRTPFMQHISQDGVAVG